MKEKPDVLGPLKLHYLRWLLFPINGDAYFIYKGSSIPNSISPRKTPWPSSAARVSIRCSRTSEGFPKDWKTNPDGFAKFVRAHQVPSFLEYGEYPFFSADEIKKALRIKSAFTEMLDQLQ